MSEMTDNEVESATTNKEIAGLRAMLDGMHDRNRELARQLHMLMTECGFVRPTEEAEGGVPCLWCEKLRTPGKACGSSGCHGETLWSDAQGIRDRKNEMIGRLAAAVDRIEEMRDVLGVALRERDEARAIATRLAVSVVDGARRERAAEFDIRDTEIVSRWGWNCRDRKGADPAEWPEDLRVREFPKEKP